MIYADNASTTKISELAFEKMMPFFQEQYGNASSQYSFGAKAKRAIEQARKQVAVAIGAEPSEITFTSGGSEANSWVFRGITEKYRSEPNHIITSVIEHHSVLNACHSLEKSGVEITYLPVNTQGQVSVVDVEKSLKPHTRLVSIMLANNEIGTLQPIVEIGRVLKTKGILFHTDAVQAVGHIPVNVAELNVDLLTASAHKWGGAKGTGVLYKKEAVNLSPLVFGGEQEHGRRGGTENVAGIVAAGFALDECINLMDSEMKRLNTMTENTIKGIVEQAPVIMVNGSATCRLPNIVNLCFEDVSGESIMHFLDLKGICISTSSACNSGKDEASHVLCALGLTEQQAKSSIRISYGRYNTSDDVEQIVKLICEVYHKIKTSQSLPD